MKTNLFIAAACALFLTACNSGGTTSSTMTNDSVGTISGTPTTDTTTTAPHNIDSTHSSSPGTGTNGSGSGAAGSGGGGPQ